MKSFIEPTTKRRVLWVGDAGVPSGFALSTHKILERWLDSFEPTCLGVNYRGDPHNYPYQIFAAEPGGDPLGIGRLIWMCDIVKPDIIVIQADVWYFSHYIAQLRRFPEYAKVPVIGIVAVDGKHCDGSQLKGLSLAIFWTKFGMEEARKGGYTGPAVVIPLGVDTTVYYPEDKREARIRRGFPESHLDAFIVGNVNRNQRRKRWDLTLEYFAEWVHSGVLKDAYLYLHTAPTGDQDGVDVVKMASYYGIASRIIRVEPPTFYGMNEAEMRDTYNSFDVQISTTQGEGFGLTTFEGMACQVPQIVPAWSALNELLSDGAGRLIPCTSTCLSGPSVVGGVPDKRMFIRELDMLWRNKQARAEVAAAGYKRALEDRFRWANVGDGVRMVAELVIRGATERAQREAENRMTETEAIETLLGYDQAQKIADKQLAEAAGW